ncbi:MAG: hypothetical protein ACI9R3_002181 [Verrucomicrobiales bacterium]|jgi:hypothetical protein
MQRNSIDEEAFVNVGVIKEGDCLEGCEGLAGSGGLPDVTVAAVLMDAVEDLLNCVDLMGRIKRSFCSVATITM